jgi:hypothetical protein
MKVNIIGCDLHSRYQVVAWVLSGVRDVIVSERSSDRWETLSNSLSHHQP